MRVVGDSCSGAGAGAMGKERGACLPFLGGSKAWGGKVRWRWAFLPLLDGARRGMDWKARQPPVASFAERIGLRDVKNMWRNDRSAHSQVQVVVVHGPDRCCIAIGIQSSAHPPR